jgi:6,7-dimethyl-8-ribityllumazine synthase
MSLTARRRHRREPTSAPGRAPGEWALVASLFNQAVVDKLLDGARTCLNEHGVSPARIRVIRVPGAFEVPQAAARLAGWPVPARGRLRPAGIVALAAVVRGETPHFEYICTVVSRALMEIALHGGIPLGFGVLTCDTVADAMARAGGDRGNKGYEAAAAAFELAEALDAPRPPRGPGRRRPEGR